MNKKKIAAFTCALGFKTSRIDMASTSGKIHEKFLKLEMKGGWQPE
ncbi:MAG: hypothetical protein M1511_05785 [Deltaproteobacteria bacterium]|nr:hypothetical protein [Deltaproteobacteria bacterium]